MYFSRWYIQDSNRFFFDLFNVGEYLFPFCSIEMNPKQMFRSILNRLYNSKYLIYSIMLNRIKPRTIPEYKPNIGRTYQNETCMGFFFVDTKHKQLDLTMARIFFFTEH